MKQALLFILLTLSPFSLYALDDVINPCEVLRNDDPEYEICLHYEKLKQEFKSLSTPIEIENISYYKIWRLINEADILSKGEQGSTYFRPWMEYSKETWIRWEKGNSLLKKNVENQLLKEMELHSLHRLAISDRSSYAHKVGLFKTGLWREISMNYSLLSTTLLDKMDEICRFNSELFNNQYTFYYRHLSFLNSIHFFHLNPIYIEKEMNILIEEVDRYIKSKRNHERVQAGPLSYPPYKFMSYIQKKLILIHPYHEGNGRISRYIQDYLSLSLGLPYVLGGKLQDDIVFDLDTYHQKTLYETNTLLTVLDECLKDYQNNLSNMNSRCFILYGDNKDKKGFSIEGKIVSSQISKDLNFQNKKINLLSDEIDSKKIEMIRSHAFQFEQNSVFYSYSGKLSDVFWNSAKMSRYVFNKLYKNHTYFDTAGNSRFGFGLYVSTNIYDSATYASPSYSIPFNNYSHMYVINMKKGEKYIDLYNDDTILSEIISSFDNQLRYSLFLNNMIRKDPYYDESKGDRLGVYKKIISQFRETHSDVELSEYEIIEYLYEDHFYGKSKIKIETDLLNYLIDEIYHLSGINLSIRLTNTWWVLRNTDYDSFSIHVASENNTNDDIFIQSKLICEKNRNAIDFIGDIYDKKVDKEIDFWHKEFLETKKRSKKNQYKWIPNNGCYDVFQKTVTEWELCEEVSPTYVKVYLPIGFKEERLILVEKATERVLYLTTFTKAELNKLSLSLLKKMPLEQYVLRKWTNHSL